MPAAQGVDEALMAALSCSWDNAYCLLGLPKSTYSFSTCEEEKAIRGLQEEIMRTGDCLNYHCQV